MNITVSPEDFSFYQTLLMENSGLHLTEEKTYLLETRLKPVALSLGYSTLDRFTAELRKTMDKELVRTVFEAMTTNETSFFRDSKPFIALRDLLPQLMQRNEATKTIRIWSAACSSGQESYSIAMVMQEFLAAHPGWKCQIIGTDISEDILEQAQKAQYSQFEVQRGLTIQMMLKHFTQVGNKWHLKDDLKQMVQFKKLNLLDDPSSLGTFDIIFCRNVLIYFNASTKEKVLNNLSKQLATNGQLFLGACETLMNLNTPLKQMPSYVGIFTLPLATDNRAAG